MKKRYGPEQIVAKLRQADVELGKGLNVARYGDGTLNVEAGGAWFLTPMVTSVLNPAQQVWRLSPIPVHSGTIRVA